MSNSSTLTLICKNDTQVKKTYSAILTCTEKLNFSVLELKIGYKLGSGKINTLNKMMLILFDFKSFLCKQRSS